MEIFSHFTLNQQVWQQFYHCFHLQMKQKALTFIAGQMQGVLFKTCTTPGFPCLLNVKNSMLIICNHASNLIHHSKNSWVFSDAVCKGRHGDIYPLTLIIYERKILFISHYPGQVYNLLKCMHVILYICYFLQSFHFSLSPGARVALPVIAPKYHPKYQYKYQYMIVIHIVIHDIVWVRECVNLW